MPLAKRAFTILVLLLLLTLIADCGHRARVDDLRGFAHRAARAGLWREALHRWEQALALAPGEPALLNNLAVAHEALGDYARARELYESAAALDPQEDDYRDNLLAFRKAHPELYPPEEGDED